MNDIPPCDAYDYSNKPAIADKFCSSLVHVTLPAKTVLQFYLSMESEIQRAICDYLALRKVFFFRCNNQPIFDAARKVFRALPKYTMKGIPDIIAIKDGRFISIEVKGRKGQLSPDQVEFGRLCMRNGAEYIVAKSIDDVQSHGL
jgi:hypothetical protein